MKKFLPLLFVLICGTASELAAQWSAFIPNRDAYYVHNTGFGAMEVDAIHADSVGAAGSFTEYRDYRREVPSQMWTMNCLSFLDTSWTGHSILLDTTTQETVFFNETNDSIVFSGSAGVGQQGMIFNFPNGSKIIGTVSTITQVTFMNITDSVKTITMQAYNSFNVPVANYFNFLTIQVSKTHGFLRAYNWKKFPVDTVAYVLHGMTNPIEGIVEQEAASIFDFNIGDRFDIVLAMNQNAMSNPSVMTYITRYVTAKTISANGDTITYTYLQDYTQKIGTTILQQYTGATVVIPVVLSEMDSLYGLNLLPLEFAGGPDTTFGYSAKTSAWPYEPAMYNGRWQKSYHYSMWWYYDQPQSCYMPANLSWGQCDGEQLRFAQGIGQVWGHGGSALCFSDFNLVYYDKGTEVWGNPHNWSVINTVSDPVAESQIVRSWPNPANDVLNIALPGEDSKNLTYQIYTISGQLAVSGNAPANGGILQIPVNQLAEGAYTVVISGESQSWISRFVR